MANPLGEVAGQLGNKVFSGILWFGIGFIILACVAGVMYYFFVYKKRFNIDVKIISKRAKDKYLILFDKAAILIDRKDGSKYLSLWTTKVDLPVPDFNILQLGDKRDYLELFRSGENNFYYLLPPKIDKTYIVKDGDKIVPMANQSVRKVNPDMEFWNVKRKTMNKGMFDPESIWMKIVPLLPQLLGGVFIIFVLWILMSKLPEILGQLQELAGILNTGKGAVITTG